MKKQGFTLMETLTVIIIVSILAAIAIPQYQKVIKRSHFTKAQVMAKAMHDSCERLVSAYGAESYDDLPTSPTNVKTITRFDIGSYVLLPTGFAMDPEHNSISGAGFTYTITGDCEVDITTYDNNLSIRYNGTSLTCTKNYDGLCEIYGLL